MPYPTPFPYPNTVPLMDLTAPNIIFSLRAICPGVSVAGSGPVLVIGDSIVNQVPEAYSACGYNVLKFAVNGMRGHDIIPFLGLILAESQPSVVVTGRPANESTRAQLPSEPKVRRRSTWLSWSPFTGSSRK